MSSEVVLSTPHISSVHLSDSNIMVTEPQLQRLCGGAAKNCWIPKSQSLLSWSKLQEAPAEESHLHSINKIKEFLLHF